MQTLLIISIIYVIGFWLAWLIALYFINHYKTNDNPIIPAILSWITVLLVIIVLIRKL